MHDLLCNCPSEWEILGAIFWSYTTIEKSESELVFIKCPEKSKKHRFLQKSLPAEIRLGIGSDKLRLNYIWMSPDVCTNTSTANIKHFQKNLQKKIHNKYKTLQIHFVSLGALAWSMLHLDLHCILTLRSVLNCLGTVLNFLNCPELSYMVEWTRSSKESSPIRAIFCHFLSFFLGNLAVDVELGEVWW